MLNLCEYDFRAGGFQSEIRRDTHSQIEIQLIIVLRDIELQSRAVLVRVHIIGG